MFRPTPGPFLGSTCETGVEAGACASSIVACFSAVALLGAASVAIGACLHGVHTDPFDILKLVCIALLAPSVLGMWLARQAASESRRLISRIHDGVMTRPARDTLAAPRAVETGVDGVVGLIGTLALRAQRLGSAEETARSMRQAVSAGRMQADRLAAELGRHAASLTVAATQIDEAQNSVARETEASAHAFAFGETALTRAAEATERLIDRVSATTSHISQMGSIATRLSEAAHATHKAVAENAERASILASTLDEIGRFIRAVAALNGQTSQHPASADQDGALHIRDAALHCEHALAAAQPILRALMQEAAAASRRTSDMAETIAQQHEAGQAMGYAVQQQSADIDAILKEMYEARSGFAMLRASVEAVSTASARPANAIGRVRAAALRLPSEGERLAQMLRGIPDFGSSIGG